MKTKAIVSDIAGTTRDSIEDELVIKGYNFRFIDTAGIRKTKDKIENLGIEKTLSQANKSSIIIYLIDATLDINQQIKDIKKLEKEDQKKIIKVINKIDLKNSIRNQIKDSIYISAKDQNSLEGLKEKILDFANLEKLSNNTIITNQRHFEQLKQTLNELELVIEGLNNGLSSDLLAINIKQSLFHLGLITGEVSTDDLLANIFGKFCIGSNVSCC